MIKDSPKPIDVPAEIEPLIAAIRQKMNPESIWLFGSRARGDSRPDSDWDIFVALPDEADAALLDPIVGWTIQHEIGIPATIVTATSTQMAEGWGAVNTLGYELARDARLLDG